MASELKVLNDIIGFAAVDCSQQNNLQLCRTFNIAMYPTLKIFPPIYNSSRSTSSIDLQSQSPLIIKREIFKVLTDFPTSSWPSLKPLDKIENIWLEKKDFHRHVLLIFEETQYSIVGSQLMLSVRNFENVLLRRMLKDNVIMFGISKFPSLYKINKDSTYTVLAVGSSDDDEEHQALFFKVISNLSGDHLNMSSVGLKPHLISQNVHADSTGRGKIKPRFNSTKVRMQDLESTLHYSFRQEVAIIKAIEGDRLEALKEFITVLMKYFPGRKPVLGFLHHVYNMLNNLEQKSLTGEEWLEKIDLVQDKDNFLPSVIEWESCLGSSPIYRGYPCGMWTLFHVLTVASYLQHQKARPSDPGNPQEVLLAIKGYMKHFFGCQECSKNFLSMADTIPNEVKSWKDEVMWLWSAHNKANKRLHTDISEDPEFPKVQFPPESLCASCKKLSQSDDGATMSWDADAVLEFLLDFYSEKGIVFSIHLQSEDDDTRSTPVAPAEHRELDWWEKKQRKEDLKQVLWLRGQRKLKKKEFKRSLEDVHGGAFKKRLVGESSAGLLSSWGLTQLDVSMCIIFYLFSTFIILFLYHHFIARKRIVSCKTSKHYS
ncbi:Sulfhydryl oxidase 1 [Bulinus truncatus]|nr:Sulfhydryl oxidase 1 [Bulinus truncatus]